MNGVRQFGGEFQNLRERFVRERVIEAFINVFEGHAIRETFENERDRKPRPTIAGISGMPGLFTAPTYTTRKALSGYSDPPRFFNRRR